MQRGHTTQLHHLVGVSGTFPNSKFLLNINELAFVRKSPAQNPELFGTLANKVHLISR